MFVKCSIEFCDKPVSYKFTRGKFKGYNPLCKAHGEKLRRNGDPLKTVPLGAPKGSTWRKPGRIYLKNGYIKLYKPEHPNADKRGYIAEHTVVMSESLGRPLYNDENVHHKNGNRQDNRIENLELWSTKQPKGQRIEDKLEYAYEILKRYGKTCG